MASPAEGTELIRAFLNIHQPDVRAAIVELVTRLSKIGSELRITLSGPCFVAAGKIVADWTVRHFDFGNSHI